MRTICRQPKQVWHWLLKTAPGERLWYTATMWYNKIWCRRASTLRAHNTPLPFCILVCGLFQSTLSLILGPGCNHIPQSSFGQEGLVALYPPSELLCETHWTWGAASRRINVVCGKPGKFNLQDGAHALSCYQDTDMIYVWYLPGKALDLNQISGGFASWALLPTTLQRLLRSSDLCNINSKGVAVGLIDVVPVPWGSCNYCRVQWMFIAAADRVASIIHNAGKYRKKVYSLPSLHSVFHNWAERAESMLRILETIQLLNRRRRWFSVWCGPCTLAPQCCSTSCVGLKSNMSLLNHTHLTVSCWTMVTWISLLTSSNRHHSNVIQYGQLVWWPALMSDAPFAITLFAKDLSPGALRFVAINCFGLSKAPNLVSWILKPRFPKANLAIWLL